MSKSKKNTSNIKAQHNSLPKIVFTSFRICRIISTFFMVASMCISVYIIYNILKGVYSFSHEELKDFADFTLNIIFVIAALCFTIFTLPISKVHPEKDKIMLSYIGQICVMASTAIFTYIVSYCTFLPKIIFGLYFCAMIFVLCGCITKLLAVIVGYFDIRD